MPQRTLRFCPQCISTEHAAGRLHCRACGAALRPLLDDAGALSGEFLVARNSCCGSGCRNCPYPGREVDPLQATQSVKTKTCGRCGGDFECRSTGCWCEQVRLSPAALQWLQRTYTDCLCPACLSNHAAK
ncbi:MAG TPA: cysteine-rich CWC family protein [Tepidisphaeraceae bacterium]